MWATMRWSGRTDWASMRQPRLSTSIVSTIPKPWPASPSRSWTVDLGRVGHQHAAAVHGPGGVLHGPPRLRQAEHHPVEIGLVDALVDVPQLDRVALERLGAEEGGDVLGGPLAKSWRSS